MVCHGSGGKRGQPAIIPRETDEALVGRYEETVAVVVSTNNS